MANYFTDHPEIAFYLNHPLMKRIVELKERNFTEAEKYPEAPVCSATSPRTSSSPIPSPSTSKVRISRMAA